MKYSVFQHHYFDFIPEGDTITVHFPLSTVNFERSGKHQFVLPQRKKVLDKRTHLVFNRHIIFQTDEAEVKLLVASTESSGC